MERKSFFNKSRKAVNIGVVASALLTGGFAGAEIHAVISNNNKSIERTTGQEGIIATTTTQIVSKDQPAEGGVYNYEMKSELEKVYKERGVLGDYPIDTIKIVPYANVDSENLGLSVSWGKQISESQFFTNISKYKSVNDERALVNDKERVVGPYSFEFLFRAPKIEKIGNDEMAHIKFTLPLSRFRTDNRDPMMVEAMGSWFKDTKEGIINADNGTFKDPIGSAFWGIFNPEITIYLPEDTYQAVYSNVDYMHFYEGKIWEPKEWNAAGENPAKNELNKQEKEALQYARDQIKKRDFNMGDAIDAWTYAFEISKSKVKDVEFIEKDVHGKKEKFVRVTWFRSTQGHSFQPFSGNEAGTREVSADIPVGQIDLYVDSFDPLEEETPYIEKNEVFDLNISPELYKRFVITGNINDLLSTGFRVFLHMTPEQAKEFGMIAKDKSVK